MTDELTSLRQTDTFDLVDLPKGKNVVKGKWVYATKEDAEGMTSFKARYVAKGYSQEKGIDYVGLEYPNHHLAGVHRQGYPTRKCYCLSV